MARGAGRHQLPPLLRHQRARGFAPGEPRDLRRDAQAGGGARALGVGGCASRRPSRRPLRPARVLHAPAGGVRTPDLRRGREDRGAIREPARGLAGARHHGLSLRQRGERTLRRSRGGVAPDARLPGVRGRCHTVRRDRAALEAPGAQERARERAHGAHEPARAHRARRSQHARLHLHDAARGSHRGDRRLPGLSHLRRRPRRARRPAATSSGP